MGDGAEVLRGLVAGHADAGVLDDEDPGVLACGERDRGLQICVAQVGLDQGLETRLVQGVRGVGDELA